MFPPEPVLRQRKTLLQAWISGWFLRISWVLVKRILPNKIVWDFPITHSNCSRDPRSKSFCRLQVVLDSLDTAGAGQACHGPQPSNCLWLGSAARLRVEGPVQGPQSLWEATILTKKDTWFLEKHALGHWGHWLMEPAGTSPGFFWAVLMGLGPSWSQIPGCQGFLVRWSVEFIYSLLSPNYHHQSRDNDPVSNIQHPLGILDECRRSLCKFYLVLPLSECPLTLSYPI